ncbi:MAG: ABC transporter permease, partial [Rhodospirillales bacterium]|nr:ABC transporter permease [Rhodospirillales bacterium]
MALAPTATPTERISYYLLWIFCGAIFFFLLVPILVVLPLSFNPISFFTYPMSGFSLRWYEDYLFRQNWQLATRNSFLIATLTMCVATPLGTLAALGLNRATFKFRPVIVGVLIAPLVVPVIITACGTYFFFSWLGLTSTLTGLVLAHTVLATPFVVIIVTATLAGFDTNLVRAASSLGATPVRVFFTVIMPIIMPGLVTSAVFAFVTSFDEVVIVNFIASVEQHTLTREIWKGIREELSPTVLAVATIMVLIS